jgi:hypothetical protein
MYCRSPLSLLFVLMPLKALTARSSGGILRFVSHNAAQEQRGQFKTKISIFNMVCLIQF